MIAYNLHCREGHEFEGWFSNSAAYDAQSKAGALSCPVCGDETISKAIMAPAVKNSVTKAKGKSEPAAPADTTKVRQYIAGLRKFIEENAENVGREFPEEVRKIHYGEKDARPIYGESTLGEARELIDEGIEIAPLPPDPDELN